MDTADLEFFSITWLVHLAVYQIQSFIILWSIWVTLFLENQI